MPSDQEIMAVAHQIDDGLVEGDASDLEQTVHDHTASGYHREFRSLAAEIHDKHALGILHIQIQPYGVSDRTLNNIHFLGLGRRMDDQIEERFLLHFCHIRRDGDYILRTSGKLPVLLQQILQQKLHIVESGDNAFLHREHNLDIGRRLLVHQKRIVTYRKNIASVLKRNNIFLFPYGISLFIINLDLIGTEIKAVYIPRHLTRSFLIACPLPENSYNNYCQ